MYKVLGSPNQNNTTSSTKIGRVILSTLENLMPGTFHSLFFESNILLKNFEKSKKNKGDKGKPFLEPLKHLKKQVGDPLTKIAKFFDDTQAKI